MFRIIKNSIKWIVNTNTWIALATFCFYQLTLLQVGKNIQWNATAFCLFFATLLVYNLFQLIGLKNEPKQWYIQNLKSIKAIILFALAMLVYLVFQLDKTTLFYLSIATLFSFFYATPFIHLGKNDFNLRKLWFLKSMIVALVWLIACVVIPLSQNELLNSNSLMFLCEKFLFIWGITIPYDIKDLKADTKVNGMQTIAMKFGVKNTIYISNIILLIACILALNTYQTNTFAIVLAYAFPILLHFNLNEKRNAYWFTFLIDFSIILYFTLVYAFN